MRHTGNCEDSFKAARRLQSVLEILCFGPELLESFHFYKNLGVTTLTRIIIMMFILDILTPNS